MVLIFQLKLYWTLILDGNSTSEGEEKFCCNAPVDLVMCGLRDVTAEYTLSPFKFDKITRCFLMAVLTSQPQVTQQHESVCL